MHLIALLLAFLLLQGTLGTSTPYLRGVITIDSTSSSSRSSSSGSRSSARSSDRTGAVALASNTNTTSSRSIQVFRTSLNDTTQHRDLISGKTKRLRKPETLTNLFVIAIRFVGPLAFQKEKNPAGAIRCEIFSRITLPALVSATNNCPPNSDVRIVLVNSSAVLEPTCKRIVEKTKNLLGKKLRFINSTHDIFEAMGDLSQDVLYFSRLDTDDAFGPDTIAELSNVFMQSNLPVAILSPFYGNLWYPTAGKEDCGDMIYNINMKNYPVMQTTAIYKEEFMTLMRLKTKHELSSWLGKEGKSIMPYHFEHLSPIQAFIRLQFGRAWDCSDPSDCILYYNTYDANGVPGMIYTQTGLQSSLARRGWTSADHLKWYDRYHFDPKMPPVCKTLQFFSIDKTQIRDLRGMIAEAAKSLSMKAINAGYFHTPEADKLHHPPLPEVKTTGNKKEENARGSGGRGGSGNAAQKKPVVQKPADKEGELVLRPAEVNGLDAELETYRGQQESLVNSPIDGTEETVAHETIYPPINMPAVPY